MEINPLVVQTKIRDIIHKGIDKAFIYLKSCLKNSTSIYSGYLILFKEYNDLELSNIQGVITNEEYSVKSNRLIKKILALAAQISPPDLIGSKEIEPSTEELKNILIIRDRQIDELLNEKDELLNRIQTLNRKVLRLEVELKSYDVHEIMRKLNKRKEDQKKLTKLKKDSLRLKEVEKELLKERSKSHKMRERIEMSNLPIRNQKFIFCPNCSEKILITI